MKNRNLLLFFAAGLAFAGPAFAGTAAQADSRVEVIFSHPERFRDVRDSFAGTDTGRDAILDDLRAYLEQRAALYVPEGQKLTIIFTDIDLAGDFEPARGPQFDDIRIVKDIYPPQMELEFKLTDASGKVIKEGKRTLTDLAFHTRINIVNQNDPRVHEKALLDDWLRGEFRRVKG